MREYGTPLKKSQYDQDAVYDINIGTHQNLILLE